MKYGGIKKQMRAKEGVVIELSKKYQGNRAVIMYRHESWL